MLTTFPQCSFSLEFPEILSQNPTCLCYNRQSVSGISKIMHCGILINMPYWQNQSIKIFRHVIDKKTEAYCQTQKSLHF